MSGETILIEQLRADVERLTSRAEKAERERVDAIDAMNDERETLAATEHQLTATVERAEKAERERDEARDECTKAIQAMPHDDEIAAFRSLVRYVGHSGASENTCDSADALTRWLNVVEATLQSISANTALRANAAKVKP